MSGRRSRFCAPRTAGRAGRSVSPPGAGDLQFRDIEAFDARRPVQLAVGEGEASRVYRTDDGGTAWTETFRNTDAKAFHDCLTFFDRRHGLAMSDPVDADFRILSTRDGGRSWNMLPNDGMPPAQDGEAGFAASGHCLVSSGPTDVWPATGEAARARVLRSSDRGPTRTATDTPIPAWDPARGVFALAFRDRTRGIAAGGDHLFGCRLAAAQPHRRPRGRPDRHAPAHHGRRPHLADGRHGLFLRHRGAPPTWSAGRPGGRRKGARGTSRALIPPGGLGVPGHRTREE